MVCMVLCGHMRVRKCAMQQRPWDISETRFCSSLFPSSIQGPRGFHARATLAHCWLQPWARTHLGPGFDAMDASSFEDDPLLSILRSGGLFQWHDAYPLVLKRPAAAQNRTTDGRLHESGPDFPRGSKHHLGSPPSFPPFSSPRTHLTGRKNGGCGGSREKPSLGIRCPRSCQCPETSVAFPRLHLASTAHRTTLSMHPDYLLAWGLLLLKHVEVEMVVESARPVPHDLFCRHYPSSPWMGVKVVKRQREVENCCVFVKSMNATAVARRVQTSKPPRIDALEMRGRRRMAHLREWRVGSPLGNE